MEKDASQPRESEVDEDAAPRDPFQSALEAKKNRGAYGPGGSSGGGAAGRGSSAKAGGRREFRRKSG